MRSILSKWLPIAFGVVSLGLLPFWAVHFFRFGSVLDGNYVANHYHYPFEEILDTAAGGFVWLIAVILYILFGSIYERFPRNFRLPIVFSITTLIFALNGWLGAAVLNRIMMMRGYAETPTAASLIVIAITALCAGSLFMLLWWKRVGLEGRLAKLASSFGIPVGLVLLLNVGAGFWQLGFPLSLDFTPGAPNISRSPPPLNSPQQRLIWVIFDGWDHDLTFVDREPTVEMPHADTLSQSSFWAKNAVTPGTGTLLSVPGLTTGKKVDDYVSLGAEHEVKFTGASTFVPWSAEPTIFSDVADKGFRSAILSHDLQGHPYCRIFNKSLSKCWENDQWVTSSINILDRLAGIFTTTNDLVQRYWEPRTLNGILGLKEKFDTFNNAAFETVCDQNIDFTYIHWMIPHAPFFYTRVDDSYADGVWGPYSQRYSDNLVLTDITLGMLFEKLKSCGAEANTAVIVTADHGQDGRVHPVFMVKLPSQNGNYVFDGIADLLKLRKLMNSIIDTKVTTYEDIRANFE